jgi:nucleoid-associated protein YgaU
LALGIVAGGVALALLLGRPDPPREAGAPDAGDHIVLRRRVGSQTLQSASDPRLAPSDELPAASIASFPVSPEATVAVRAGKPDVLPPTLAKSFPAVDMANSARWGVSMGIGMSGSRVVGESARTHRIVNGDSLPTLAKRYLGSEQRAGEIFEANLDLLSSPDALPIGVELRIPPRDLSPAEGKQTSGTPSLVPIGPRGSRSQEGARGGTL